MNATVSFSLPDEALETLARRVADLVAQQERATSRWLDVDAAAEYLSTTPDGIRGMVRRRQIPFQQAQRANPVRPARTRPVAAGLMNRLTDTATGPTLRRSSQAGGRCANSPALGSKEVSP